METIQVMLYPGLSNVYVGRANSKVEGVEMLGTDVGETTLDASEVQELLQDG